MFIVPTIARVPSGLSEYIWLDTTIVLKQNSKMAAHMINMSLYKSYE